MDALDAIRCRCCCWCLAQEMSEFFFGSLSHLGPIYSVCAVKSTVGETSHVDICINLEANASSTRLKP